MGCSDENRCSFYSPQVRIISSDIAMPKIWPMFRIPEVLIYSKLAYEREGQFEEFKDGSNVYVRQKFILFFKWVGWFLTISNAVECNQQEDSAYCGHVCYLGKTEIVKE